MSCGQKENNIVLLELHTGASILVYSSLREDFGDVLPEVEKDGTP